MKNIISFTVFYLSVAHACAAQNIRMPEREYQAWIHTSERLFSRQGYLAELKDSSIVMEARLYADPAIELKLENIKTIRVRKRGKVGKSILIGASIGFGLGAIYGAAQGDDPSCSKNAIVCFSFSAGQKALFFGAPGALAGGIVGGLIGSIRMKYSIGGQSSNYRDFRKKMALRIGK